MFVGTSVIAVLVFFSAHWLLSIFCQTFFLHRYASHRQFTMTRAWERVFYLATVATQGASFLVPRAYAILHREHHAFSDGPGDPHSPHVFPSLWRMMWATRIRYTGLVERTIHPEPRFEGGYPEWRRLVRLADHWGVRIAWGVLYTLFYVAFAPAWMFVLLPIHYLMGPVHGAIVNWCGHKYGYRNFKTSDQSRNTLPFDFLTLGELFQNNHHRFAMAPRFAVRWFEVDPTYWVIRLFAALGIIRLDHPQRMVWAPAA
jgi:stearoyl-CoA desaturase (delta-9 desaturase)